MNEPDIIKFAREDRERRRQTAQEKSGAQGNDMGSIPVESSVRALRGGRKPAPTPSNDVSEPEQPAVALPGSFVAIARTPGINLFWNQAGADWVGLLEADHYPSEEYARALIEAQPYMHTFFANAVMQRFTVAPDASAASPLVLSRTV